MIADDISKLRIKLVKREGRIWTEFESSAFSPVLRKPNRYQTRIQFISQMLRVAACQNDGSSLDGIELPPSCRARLLRRTRFRSLP